MGLAGLSVQQDHWKDNTSRKQDNLSHSANRILLTAPPVMAIMAARVDSWIMLSRTSKPMEESIPRLVTRMRLVTASADFKQATLELQTLVRYSEIVFKADCNFYMLFLKSVTH